jgi:large subunit ribosomal protein L17
MRHKRKGRRLGRNSSHRKALFRNLMTALILTERDESFYEGLVDSDGKPVNPPAHKGRIITTHQKAKEVKPMVERLITIAKKSIPFQEQANRFSTDAERNSAQWKSWRESQAYKDWVAAVAPVVNARRRAFAVLRDKEAVRILFDDIAPRFVDRPGGYTRIMKLATPRLGDNGTRAILEFVGKHDRVADRSLTAAAPTFEDQSGGTSEDEN